MSSQEQSLPWEGRPERVDLIILGGIIASGVYALALLPFVPTLVGTHPALLELLRGSTASIVAMGALARTGHTSLVIALCSGIPALIAFDWAYWWAGRRWGAGALRMVGGAQPRAIRRAERVRRLMARFGPAAVVLAYVLPVPTALVDAAAGWSRMRLSVFLACDAIGALLWAGLLVALGYSLGQSAVDVTHAISRYSLLITVGLVVVIVLRQAMRRRGPVE